MNKIIVIPAYEPDRLLIKLLETIPRTYQVVIVDDGSKAAYESIFKEAMTYAHVISYQENAGKGHALKEAFKYIKENYQEYIVATMDSDMQHTITDCEKLIEAASNNLNTLILGKRLFNKKVPLRSRLGNSITRNIYKKVSGLKIYDTQTGLRAFSYKLIDYMLSLPGNRYEYEMNMLLNLKSQGIDYLEIPIETIYFDHNKKSHFNTYKDAYQIYKSIYIWKKNYKKKKK